MDLKLKCKLIETTLELDEAHEIRRVVFVEEQKVPPKIEWDEFEESALHMICKLGDIAVGTGRITFFGDSAKVERVAVLKEYRNQGIGTKITRFIIDECKKRYAKTIYAHVQMHAYDFYKKMGFYEVGDIFDEAGIDHIKMVLKD